MTRLNDHVHAWLQPGSQLGAQQEGVIPEWCHSVQPDDYFAKSEAFRNNVAKLVGCSADQVAIAPAVSYGIGVAAHNLSLIPI